MPTPHALAFLVQQALRNPPPPRAGFVGLLLIAGVCLVGGVGGVLLGFAARKRQAPPTHVAGVSVQQQAGLPLPKRVRSKPPKAAPGSTSRGARAGALARLARGMAPFPVDD